MKNKTLIYGGSGGIGSVLANKIVEAGDDLHLAGKNEEQIRLLANTLGCSYTIGNAFEQDFFSKATEEAGAELNSVVYAIGTINLKSLNRLSSEDFINDYQINVMGAAFAVKAALDSLKKNNGSVVLFSSVASTTGFPMHASIGSSKGAINGLTLSLAAELSPSVRVNAIAPSLTDTPLASRVLANDKVKESIANMHPLKKLGSPEDIANLAFYLISKQSSWMTGQIIGLDGGRSNLASM